MECKECKKQINKELAVWYEEYNIIPLCPKCSAKETSKEHRADLLKYFKKTAICLKCKKPFGFDVKRPNGFCYICQARFYAKELSIA